MATWTRNGTSLPSSSAEDGDLSLTISFDNATAPSDFDPAAVNSVRFVSDTTGSGFSDDTWTANNIRRLAIAAGGAVLATITGLNTTSLQNETHNRDATDSAPNNTATIEEWEGARIESSFGGTVVFGTNVRNMGADGGVITLDFQTIIIDYTPDTSGTNYDETGRANTITATIGLTDQADFIDTAKATTITSTTALSDIASFIETLQNVIITSTILSLDVLAFNDENLPTVITGTTALVDQADFVDVLANTITATIDTSDALSVVESIAISITSTIGTSDTLTPAGGDTFDETGRAITITATITTTDELTMTETLATTINATTVVSNVQDMVQAALANTITSTVGATDDLTMTEVSDIVGAVTVELLDLAALVDDMAITIISFIGGTDTFDDGAPRSYYQERLWRTNRDRFNRNR